MIEKETIINQMIYHSLQIILAKSLKRNFDKLQPAVQSLLGSESHKSLVALNDTNTTLQLEIKRHITILISLSTTLLKKSNITTEINIEEIIPFSIEEIEQGYIKIPAPVDNNDIKLKDGYDYYIILNKGEILSENDDNLQSYLQNSYSKIPKGYKLLLLN